MSIEISRRNFLKCSAVAALAVASASIMTGCDSIALKYDQDGYTYQTIDDVQIKFVDNTNTSVTFAVKGKNDSFNINIVKGDFAIQSGTAKVTGIALDNGEKKDSVSIEKGDTKEHTLTVYFDEYSKDSTAFYAKFKHNLKQIEYRRVAGEVKCNKV